MSKKDIEPVEFLVVIHQRCKRCHGDRYVELPNGIVPDEAWECERCDAKVEKHKEAI
jgi:excinuclease UvrABC ATPase subunit